MMNKRTIKVDGNVIEEKRRRRSGTWDRRLYTAAGAEGLRLIPGTLD